MSAENDQLDNTWAQDKLGVAADDVYSALTAAHEGLSLAQSHRLNTRLVLMMINSIGDAALLQEMFRQARQTLDAIEEPFTARND